MMTPHDKLEMQILVIVLAFAFFMGLIFGDGSFTFTLLIGLFAYGLSVIWRIKEGWYYVENRENSVVEGKTQKASSEN